MKRIRKSKQLLAQKRQPRRTQGSFVFFIGDEGAVLLYLENNEVVRRLFSADPEAKTSETFLDLLAEYPDAPIYMLIDLMDQSYIRHTLPPVSSLGVNKIVQRRLTNDFPPNDLKGALPLGREKKGRKDWNFLLVAVGYDGRVSDWCELVYELPNRFMGVFLVPVESEHIMLRLNKYLAERTAQEAAKAEKHKTKGKRTKKAWKVPTISLKQKPKTDTPTVTKWDILVIHNKTGGFRQVVLKDGRLVFTRLAQSMPNEKATVLAGNIEQEVYNTIEYLRRLSFTDDADLNIVMIMGEEIKLNITSEHFGAKTTYIMTPNEAASMFGIEQSILSGDRFSDVLFSCIFLRLKKPRLKLMPDYVKVTESYYKITQMVRIISVLIVLSVIGLTGVGLYKGVTTSAEISDLKTKERHKQATVTDFERKAKEFEADPFRVDALIKLKEGLGSPLEHYEPVLRAVSEILDRDLTVESFSLKREPYTSSGDTTRSRYAHSGNSKNAIYDVAPEYVPFHMEVTLSLAVKQGKEEIAKRRWDTAFSAMKDALPDYTLEHDPIEGVDNTEKGLNINFSELNTAADKQVKQVAVLLNIYSTSEGSR